MLELKNLYSNTNFQKLSSEIKNLNDFHYQFTTKECIILCEVIKGYNNRQIAKRLYLSAHTVKFYVQKLLVKTKTHTRTELSAKILLILIGKEFTPDLLFECFGSK